MYPCVAVQIERKNAVIAREEALTEEGNTCHPTTDKEPGRTGLEHIIFDNQQGLGH